MFTNNIYLHQFKIHGQSHLQNMDFVCLCIKANFEENKSKICIYQSPFSPFSHQNSLTDLPSWVVWSLLFVIKPSNAFYFEPNYAKSIVHQSQACSYTQPIWVSLMILYIVGLAA